MSDFHHTTQWQRARAAIRKHYGGLCANPFGLHSFKGMITPRGQPTAATVIHHIVPVDIDPSKAVDINNLIPLCPKCHELAHTLLERTGIKGIIDYRKAFNLPADIPLTPKQREREQQPFFTRKDCQKLPNGRVSCARCGRERETPCPSCKTFKGLHASHKTSKTDSCPNGILAKGQQNIS